MAVCASDPGYVAAWVSRAPALAQWVWDHLVNRTDAWGKYHAINKRPVKKRADGSTYVETAITAKGELTLSILTAHIEGADIADLVGLHSTSCQQLCRWGAIDIDQHAEEDQEQAAANWRFVQHLIAKLDAAGINPLVMDSNGNGGFHILIPFDGEVPAKVLHRWLQFLIRDAGDFGVDDVETFPKQPKIAGYGNWIRLPGRHHTRDHWHRVWANGTWFVGEEAIDLILTHEPAPASSIEVTEVDFPPPLQLDGAAPTPNDTRPADRQMRSTTLAALRHIANDDLSYDDWLRVGAALHHVGDDMLSNWVHWSGTSDKHVPGECERVWQYFHRHRGPDVPTATLATLLKMAAERGYTPDGPANVPRFKTVGELCRDHPELRPPVVFGLLRSGESGNLVAGPKSNKSWLMLQLAISIATGRMWLDRFEVVSGPVLILDNELHEETIAHRIPKVAAAMGVNMSDLRDRLCVESLRGRLKDIHGLASYFSGLEPGRFKLIVLDALYRLLPEGIDENSNADMAGVYNAIDRYAAQLGCAFMLVHHSSKGLQSHKAVTDVGAGAGAQSRATDAHIILRPHEENGCVVVDAVVRSWAPIEPFVARWDFPIWKPALELDPTQLRRETRRPRKEDKDPVEKPKGEPWTPPRFVSEFVGDQVVDVDVALAHASLAEGLSDRLASKLLKVALHTGLIFEWPHPTDKRKKRLSTRQQTVLETGGTHPA